MKKRSLLLLTVLLAFLSWGAAYADEGTERVEEAKIGLLYLPETLDPSKVSSRNGETCILHLFEGLMKLVPDEEASFENSPDGIVPVKVVPGQADSYEISKDGLVYTFHLRDDIVWSDGEPVTAEDFVYSWRRLVRDENNCRYGSLLNGIVENASEIQRGERKTKKLSIKAIDESTLEIRLEKKNEDFLTLCASAQLVPLRLDIIKAYGNEWTEPEHFVTNGAYRLSKLKTGSYIKMRANSRYYEEDLSGPLSLRWELNRTENTDTTGLLTEKAGSDAALITDMGMDEPEGDFFFYSLPKESTIGLTFATDRLSDWRVRAAICLAADREFYVSGVLSGRYTVENEFCFTGADTQFFDYYLQNAFPEYDLNNYFDRCKLAGQLLKEAEEDGFDPTKKITLRYFTGSEKSTSFAKNFRFDMLCALDLQVTLKEYTDLAEYLRILKKGKYDIALDEWLRVPETAFGSWENEDYQNLAEDDPEYAVKANTILFSEEGFPVLPLYRNHMYCALGEDFTNVGWSEQGCFIVTYMRSE